MRKLGTALVVACALSSGCATIVEGTDQSVTVTSDPSGAMCELKRDGQTIAVVNPTPGSAVVDKSKKDISVVCTKEGYGNGGDAIASSFQGMTVGNILFGGIIGVAVDAGSGAMHEYEPSLHVVLQPTEEPRLMSQAVGQPSLGYTPLPSGTPAPYEGVRMASFSADDMRWFCSQDWRSRSSPTGRTEYNPCHHPDAFVR